MSKRLSTEEIVKGCFETALQNAQEPGILKSTPKNETLAIVRALEGVANAIMGVELAVKTLGADVSDVGPAVKSVAFELESLHSSGVLSR